MKRTKVEPCLDKVIYDYLSKIELFKHEFNLIKLYISMQKSRLKRKINLGHEVAHSNQMLCIDPRNGKSFWPKIGYCSTLFDYKNKLFNNMVSLHSMLLVKAYESFEEFIC